MNPFDGMTRKDLWRLAWIAAAYFVAQELGAFFRGFTVLIMPVWLAGGVGLVSLLLSPRRKWPAIILILVLAAGVVELLLGRSLAASGGIIAANLLESLASAWLISRWCGEGVRFNRVREVIGLLVAAVVVNAGSALVGAAAVLLNYPIPFWSAWLTWWIAHGLGLVLIAPLTLAWADAGEFLRSRWRGPRALELVVFLLVWGALAWMTFNPPVRQLHYFSFHPYVLMVLMLWAALRFGQRGVTTALVLLAGIMFTSKTAGTGPLYWGDDAQVERLLLARIYFGVAVTGLLLAANDAEKKSAHAAIAALDLRHQTLLQTGSDGIHVIDQLGNLIEVNETFCRMLGYSREELLRIKVADFEAQWSGEKLLENIQGNFARPSVFETILRAKNGTLVPVEINATAVTLDGRRYLYAAARDITKRKRAESALRVSEERYAQVERAVNDGLWDWDILTRSAYLSPRWKAILGYEDAELPNLASSFFDNIHPDDQAMAGEALRRHLEEATRYAIELRLRHKDGSYRWVFTRGDAIRDTAGRLVRIVGSMTDITERKTAELALRESEEKFAKVFRAAPVWIAVMDLGTGTYLDANEQMLRDSGFSREEIIGRTPIELGLVSAGDRELVLQAIQAHGRDTSHEMTFRTKDGRVLHGLLNGEQLKIGGRPCLLTVTIDITPRKQAEAAVKENEAKLRAMFESARDAIGVSQNGRHILANPAYLQLFGFENNEAIVGNSILDSIAPSHRQQVIERMQHRLTGEPADKFYEARGVRVDGSEFDAEVSVSTYELNGEVYSLAHIRDVTARKQAEEILRANEERYRTLVELSPEAIFVHADGRIIFANHSTAKLGGVETPDSLLGLRVMDFVQPDSRDLVEQRMRDLATGGQVAPLVRQKWRRVDGTPIEVEVVSTALQFDGRAATLVIALDVTAQRQTESELRKLSRAVEQSPVTVVITDTTGAIEYVNPSFTATCGYTLEEARGKNPRILGSGELPKEVYRELWGTITSGREWRGEFHNRRKDGELFWESATISPIADDTGKITHFLAVKEDITDRKLAESRIREQAALLDVTVDAIMVLSLDRRVMFWNRGAETLYGLTKEQALGRFYEEIAYRELPADYEVEWRQFLERGTFTKERQQVSPTRGAITVQMRATLVRDEKGHANSCLIVVTDITEGKRLEAQFLRAQRLESLGSLASGVAHDLNNVLTPILMSVELLRPLVRNEGDKDLLQLLTDSARRGSDIVQQLLLFGRGSNSPRAPMKVPGVIKEVGQMMRQTFPKDIVLSLQAPSDLWLVEADRTQIHQVLLNLCVNARDAMPNGGPLTVCAENHHVDEAFAKSHGGTRGGAYVRLGVQDSGSGIPAAHLEKIFDPFFTTKPAGEGTGLGLATVIGIVRSHGGFVVVTSREGRGSLFEVFIPATRSSAEAPVESDPRPTPTGAGEWVLLVEDEEGIRDALQQVLVNNHYQVIATTNGAEAIEAFREHGIKVKLVVTDAMMPIMGGARLITALRLNHPDLAVVVISGMASQRAEFEKKFGATVRFLPKPFTAELVLRVVRAALDSAVPPAIPSV